MQCILPLSNGPSHTTRFSFALKQRLFLGIVRHMNETGIPKTYAAEDWEDALYRKWEESGFFNPDICIKAKVTAADAAPYSIVLPPPNVTGSLHSGHAAMLAIQDILIRYHRMRGDRTLWLPGTDHAAIATQSRVEKNLIEQEGKNRYDLGREAFLQRVEAFAQQSHDSIIHQTKKMGASLDWSREAYTLDEKRSLAVRTAFKTMFDDGIIYRGYRVVNWSVAGQSTCSDDELVHIEREAILYTFRYSKEFPIPIATTRPETKLGDTAVAVHPDDTRYQQYIGQTFTADVGAEKPLEIKIIGDPAVDPKFGTGAVGVTPAHSQTDFEMYERHPDIALVQVIGQDGKMTAAAGTGYAGLTTLDAREQFVAWLRTNDLIEKEEDVVQNVGTSDRFNDVTEALPMRQWFIAVSKEFERDGKTVTLKSLMQDAVRDKKIAILPERFEKTYFHWIDNLRDWCISRQIWYGHQIPVWYKKQPATDNGQRTTEEIYCGVEPPKDREDWEQDPDTLDTWFSSGLWTFSTLGWPEQTEDLKTYHPTSVLETGYDILFFWVARMILMSEYLLGEIPFKTVYLHGLVRDEQGRKMSKSLGNILDPLDVINDHGADALRLALVIGSTPGNDLKLSDEKIIASRNFVNKLWNMSRYIALAVPTAPTAAPEAKTLSDRWILSRLSELTDAVTSLLDHNHLSLASEALRDFTWNEFADWYIEVHKIEKNDAVLVFVFNTLLRLWHPFMPFATEAIFQTFNPGRNDLLMVAKWPEHMKTRDEEANAQFTALQGLIAALRNLRAVYRIDMKVPLQYSPSSDSALFRENAPLIERLARATVTTAQTVSAQARIINPLFDASVPLESIIDIEKERARLLAEKASAEKYKAGIEGRLNDERFTSKAPAHILEQNRTALRETEKKIAELASYIENLAA